MDMFRCMNALESREKEPRRVDAALLLNLLWQRVLNTD